MNDGAPWVEREPNLERELARQLAPVTAPETLWDRIHEPGKSVPRGMPMALFAWQQVVWPAAVVVVIIFAGVLWKMSPAREPLAELPPASRDFDFRSSDFGAIRKWVKAESNIDIDLPDGAATTAAPVLLLGVRLIRFRGSPAAAIDYHVGEGAATLVVSRKQGGLTANTEAGKHLFSPMKSAGKEHLLSWNMRNQNYTIAYSGDKDLGGACLLCHANTRSLITN
jgi:hypothetical protein